MTNRQEYDVAVVGAGITGLICARQLHQAGYRVAVLDKSRGVGGRLATRRLHGTWADHGTCYLSVEDDRFRGFVEQLIAAGVLQVWTDTIHELGADGQLQPRGPVDRYVAPLGMTAVAKFLSADLTLHLNHRVEALELTTAGWCLRALAGSETESKWVEVLAPAIVIAIPAPQAQLLLQPLADLVSPELIERLQAVNFFPSLSVMAGYPPELLSEWQRAYPGVKAMTVLDDPTLAWVGLDSSKRSSPTQPVFVIQSSATFADRYLDTADLQPPATELLHHLATRLQPWLASPDWMQIHRWRYAFTRQPLGADYLAAPTSLPLVCSGDWCTGRKVNNGFGAGLATAAWIMTKLPTIKI